MERNVSLFYAMESRTDVANLLDVDLPHLRHALYVIPKDRRYRQFYIPKRGRSGEYRTIREPRRELKDLQRRLADALQDVYEFQYGPQRPSAHGFRRDRSIASMAEAHTNRKYRIRVDLEDFFPSITFPRVFGMFTKPPFSIGHDAAVALAQLCTHEDQLPQGAPTSPAISNLICARMDRQFQALARETIGLIYTRYADDIVFSSWRPMNRRLVNLDTGSPKLGPAIEEVLAGNWFTSNERKFRFDRPNDKNRILGLVVTKKVNCDRRFVRRVRSMLRLWNKHGPDSMQSRFEESLDRKHRRPGRSAPSFKNAVRGRIEFIGMIRGKSDRVYLRLLWNYRLLTEDHPSDSTYEFMTSLLAAPREDDQQNIANCYAIRDAARSLFKSEKNARKALSVSSSDWKKLGKIANDLPVVGSRHPGNHDPQEVRPMTNAERNGLFDVAEKIRSGLRDHINAKAKTP